MSALLLAFQLAQATVTGRVIDKVSNEPVSAALVQLSESGRQAVTDANGRYTFQNVSPGPQHLNVSSLGYFDRSVHALLPRVGTLELNVTLIGRPLPLPRVEVRIPPAVRGADDAGLQGFERSVSMATLRTHPNTAEPDALLALSGGHVLVRPESPSGIHVRGGASDQLVYLLDGIPIFSPYHTAGLFSAWNPDAIAQVQLSSMAPSVARPEALSGFVNARVRDPGSRSSMIGALSTTQARATIDGQVPRIGVGYLISMRAGFPDAFAPSDESSYLHGETSDMLAKVVTTGRLGMLSLIAYGSEDEIQTSASHDETLPNRFRNGFEWQAESFGIGYVPTSSGTHFELLGWFARGSANALWLPGSMHWNRRDIGGVAQLVSDRGRGGVRIEQSSTHYQTDATAFSAATPLVTAFAEHEISLPAQLTAHTGVGLTYGAHSLHISPRAQLHWQLSSNVELLTSFARLHQFAQSLRNHESVVGNVFPADLFLGAGESRMPVASSNSGVLGIAYRPFAGTRLQLQAFARKFDGLLLTAPRSAQPYADSDFASGSGVANGVGADVTVTASAFGFIASYAWQHVRAQHNDSAYIPEYGAAHNFEVGVVAFPGATWSVRLAVTGAAGRRTSDVVGALEWEACNLLDQGCEFAGTPLHDVDGIGSASMPAYLRVDAGLRKHWHVHAAGRDVQLAVFGTFTNVFGRANLLTYAQDATGERLPIEMRPRSLLLAGLDWRM